MNKIIKLISFAAAVLVTLPSLAATSIDGQNRERLDFIENTWNAGKAAELAKEIYVPSTQITGEGVDQICAGTEDVSALVAGLVKDNKHVKIDLNSTQQVSNLGHLDRHAYRKGCSAIQYEEPFRLEEQRQGLEYRRGYVYLWHHCPNRVMSTT